MSRRTFEQVYLGNLQQKYSPTNKRLYMTREEAYESLKKFSGQDFGYDVDAWKQWLKANKKAFRHNLTVKRVEQPD